MSEPPPPQETTAATTDSRSGVAAARKQNTEENERRTSPVAAVCPPSPSNLKSNHPPPAQKSSSSGTGHNKLVESIQTLQANISSTEERLRAALERISALESFQSRQTATASTPKALRPLLRSETDEAALAFADDVFARRIARLKEYNELKDIAMGMLSTIADKEGRRLAEVMEERGVDEND
jgi:hypothetical protein